MILLSGTIAASICQTVMEYGPVLMAAGSSLSVPFQMACIVQQKKDPQKTCQSHKGGKC